MSRGTRESVRPLRAIIVGGGMIGNVHRRAALLNGADVVGVVEQDMARAETAAQGWGVTNYYDSVEEALTLEPDVLHICTPNVTHAPFVRLAIEAGVNVICEKPLCLDADEGAELVRCARERNLVATVPYTYRYHPLVREIRQRRIHGEFGKIHLIHGSYLQDWLLSPHASSWRVDPALGGPSRAFADIGSHWCDLVEWVSGERIAEVVADTGIAIPARPGLAGATFSRSVVDDAPLVVVQTEDIANVLFRTESGVPGAFTLSQVSAGRKNRLWFEIDCACGSAVFDQENAEKVWLGGQRESRILTRDPGYASAEAERVTLTPAGHVQGWEACFENFVKDVYAAIRGGQPEGLPTFADGARSLKLVEAVLESAKSRQWTAVAQ
ncbi:MAG: Gfo/Idh/MocA family protein [Propionicimonas sp.]